MSLLGSHYVVEEDYYGPGIREERVVDVYDEILPVDRYPGRLGGYAEDDLYLARREARLAEDEARVAAEEANLALQHSIYNSERVAASSVDYGLGVMDGWDYYGYGDDFRGIYGYGNYGRLDAAELGLRKAEEEELWALRDLRMYEDALRLDKALSEQERLLRWRNRLDWEELAEEERQLRWERMDQVERELLGLGAEGFWGRRYGRYNYYDGRSYNHSVHPNYASSAFEAWAHDVGPHGGTGSYADRHPEIPDSNAYPGRNYITRYGGYGDYRVPDRTQLEILYGRSGVYSRGHYPLSKRLSDKYGNVLSTFASRRTVY